MSATYLAIDFGGGSGRVMAASLAGDAIKLTEVHRFANRQVRLGEYLYWDFPALWEDMKAGIKKAAAAYPDIRSLGIDTWGVDFGLIDHNGTLLGNPVCYRDFHVDGMPEKFFATTDPDSHYSRQGIQVMGINTIFRLMAMKEADDPRLKVAKSLLFMPDLFSFFLTGTVNCEYTEASTSELLDAERRDWDWDLIDSLGLPRHIFPPIVMPGTSRGKLIPDVAAELGLSPDVEVIAVGSHDTASAAYAAPAPPPGVRNAFLSSGTWSLLGVALDSPILTPEARADGWSNEGGVGGKILFLQNITGLWILQKLVAEWTHRGEGFVTDYPSLVNLAREADFPVVIDVDDPAFTAPKSMEKAIVDYCTAKGLTVPAGQGQIVSCVLHSLAHRYSVGIKSLNKLLPFDIAQLNIVGGGSNNQLLNELTEKYCGIPVEAGPAEATAIGNVKVQMQHFGEAVSL